MSCVGVGVSRESNPEAAVAEVLNSAIKEVNLSQIHWVLIFFTPDHFVHAGRPVSYTHLTLPTNREV